MRWSRSRSRLMLIWLWVLIAMAASGCAQPEAAGSAPSKDSVRVVPREAARRVDVYVGGELFTAYRYPDTLKKPVLYPIQTAQGTAVTRGYPMQARAGERTDHPHHIGLWFNYGNVNGLDFWNNSNAVSPEEADEMGTIRHRTIRRAESGEGRGVLEVTMDWLRPDGEAILREETRFVFQADSSDVRVIDRITTLTALDGRVHFQDNKEGLLGLRVTRALEMPTDEPLQLTGADGRPLEEPVLDNEGVTGHYRSSKGIEGYPDVWGTRAKWMMLSGEIQGRPVTVAILGHPNNVGFPTYWHARDYGLFAANPLGQAVFTEGEKELGFSLAPGESTTFRYRVLIISGEDTADEVKASYQDFAAAY